MLSYFTPWIIYTPLFSVAFLLLFLTRLGDALQNEKEEMAYKAFGKIGKVGWIAFVLSLPLILTILVVYIVFTVFQIIIKPGERK